jgi:ABC-type Fe3+-hydroxamate transport system substrate-binding protein
MPLFYDQLKRCIELTSVPKRIVSIVPSQTELLFDLGLDCEIIGITKFCVHPHDKVKSKLHIGGTKQLNIPLINSISPDLIIANKEENDKSQVEVLMASFPVWVSAINDFDSTLQMIAGVGELVGRLNESKLLINLIEQSFSTLQCARGLRVAYLIWCKPYMAAGQGTFINAMLKACGFENVIKSKRYPAVSENEIINAGPDVVLLSSEPYPFKIKHIAEFQKMLPSAKILLVDGEMFSWYGSRLLHAPAYYNNVIQALK